MAALGSGILAFLMGGLAAGRLGAVYDRRWGAWNGALVFMTAIPLTALLASGGLAAVLGSLGGSSIAIGFDASQGTAGTQGAAGAAWTTLGGLVPGLIAAARVQEVRRRSPGTRSAGRLQRQP